jgi:hypothetical protein
LKKKCSRIIEKSSTPKQLPSSRKAGLRGGRQNDKCTPMSKIQKFQTGSFGRLDMEWWDLFGACNDETGATIQRFPKIKFQN